MAAAATSLRITPLHDIHHRCGAKMVDFEGWEMPVQYSGLIDEHLTVRSRAGLFDVSHMGRIDIRGPEAGKLVNYVSTNDSSKLVDGQAHYSALLYEHGGFVDDILVHKIADHHFFLCVNAGNQDKDLEHVSRHNTFDCEVENAGKRYAQLALQGPRALEVLQKLTAAELRAIKYYHFVDAELSKTWARIARTGYTGEDGFEIYIPSAEAPRIWDGLLAAGAEFGVKPIGLGARNTLRLEAKMALYGHEIDASITAWEADLGWIVKLNKGDFVGRGALIQRQQRGVTRKLVGFEMRGRGIGRDGYEVQVDGAPSGWVTSGGPSPTLNKNIGLCYLPAGQTEIGRAIHVMVRQQPVEAMTIPTPFYKRAK